jgi:Flp pilus assembly pilin Flp
VYQDWGVRLKVGVDLVETVINMKNLFLIIWARMACARGQTMAEYGILIAVIAVVVVVAASLLGDSITGIFRSASTKL